MNIPASEYLATVAKPRKRSKYGNVAEEVDGIRFASGVEARRYRALKVLVDAGEIGGLKLQPRFPIILGAGIEVTTYVADFAYWDYRRDRFVVEDVKGVETDVFKIKKKLMLAVLGIEVELIKKGSKAAALRLDEVTDSCVASLRAVSAAARSR